jgi:bifunctional non-homologous end joining protein LigD
LELKGVLKSWAVPKGPSLDPEEKRLAMMTEDHPYDYKDFEGIIPKGQYGGGTVIIWDEGTYTTPDVDENDKKAQEHALTSQFYKGGILLNLHGEKLKGQFAIIRAPDKDDKSWYLLKVKDKSASKTDVTKKDKSVVSGLTIEEMAAKADARKWQSNKAGKKPLNPEEQSAGVSEVLYRQLIEKGIKAEMPKVVSPMNATLIKDIFNNDAWVYEVKLDGYRIAAIIKDGKVTLQTRSAQNYTKYYPAVVSELESFPLNIILDGEMVALDENGKPNFDLLQSYNSAVPLVYYVFDVLWLDGYDITCLNLLERKIVLLQVLPESDIVKYSEHFEDGKALWEQIQKMELEGIVAKRKDSTYQQNKRTKEWLKLPTEIRQEFVIGGWTESGSGRPFRSILFGAYEDGQLKFIGHSGSGFKDEVMKQIMDRLKPLEIRKKPFVDEVDHETTPHWVKPQLVANFKFSTWTAGGKIRKPAIFLGFREDKDAKDVVREVPLSAKEEEKIVHEEPKVQSAPKEKPVAKVNKTVVETSEDSNWPEIENQKITSSEVFDIDDCQITLTNIEKELWAGLTKAHLIQYYHSIAPYILPYLKGRAQSLHIKHIKPTVPGLYIKDMEGRQPACADTFTVKRKHKKKGKRDVIEYLVCNNEATLLYIINLGCIDINPWTSRITDYLNPDFIIIDLDPSDDDFKKVIATAKAAKQIFDKHKLKSFPKTSGKTGIHLYLPCEGFTFPEARDIAEKICKEIHALVPDITTTEVTISKRGNKLYIDPNQNDEADTVAAPYSVRPFHHPTVSTPLEWREINDQLDPLNFDIYNILERIEKKGDLFTGVMDKKIAAKNSEKLKPFL